MTNHPQFITPDWSFDIRCNLQRAYSFTCGMTHLGLASEYPYRTMLGLPHERNLMPKAIFCDFYGTLVRENGPQYREVVK
ncbi:MAG: hypothetical protein RR547_10775, partial [Raoultibacter sp.]